jgi:hypothetical protein
VTAERHGGKKKDVRKFQGKIMLFWQDNTGLDLEGMFYKCENSFVTEDNVWWWAFMTTVRSACRSHESSEFVYCRVLSTLHNGYS